MKIIDTHTLNTLSTKAKSSLRLRANLNWHPELADPVQRLLNAIEPGSYVRPHRHLSPESKWELFVVLAGALLVLILDDAGKVLARIELAAAGDNKAVEIPAGAWHTVVATQPGTVLFEFKQGPFTPLSDGDFASWAPAEGEQGVAELMQRCRTAIVGDDLKA
ncbi:MAG: WbuC family cupin fold metalloprotein [Rhodocyclales bacterium]|nr:WbuC family cupin fold metalloprotein [Rhodocyclales bacterium]